MGMGTRSVSQTPITHNLICIKSGAIKDQSGRVWCYLGMHYRRTAINSIQTSRRGMVSLIGGFIENLPCRAVEGGDV